MEYKGIKKLLKKINNKEILELWEEYEEQKTPESRFVKEIDKIEILMQAYEYQNRFKDINLKEFWPDVKRNIKNKKIVEIYKLLS